LSPNGAGRAENGDVFFRIQLRLIGNLIIDRDSAIGSNRKNKRF